LSLYNDVYIFTVPPSIIVKAYKSEEIGRARVKDLVTVTPERQIEILKSMREINNYSCNFTISLVLKTPSHQKVTDIRHRIAWAQDSERKKDLVKRLEDAQEQQTFYSKVYRDYTYNLMRILPYIREMISEEELKDYLNKNHKGILDTFQAIILDEGAE